MKRYKQIIGTVILSFCMTQLQAQEISFTALPGAATPGLGELVYDSTSDRLYIASGGNTVKVVDTSGTPDVNFAGDGILGNGAGEEPLLDAEYLAVSGNRIFISDQERGVVLVVNATSGVLDTSLATDGIIGNDAAEPDFTGLTLHDIEILDSQLYIATNTNVIKYALDGSDANSVFSTFPAQTLTTGPLTNSGICSADPIANNQLLYAIAPNNLNGFQGTVACLDITGTAQLLAQTNDVSLTDLTFAPPTGASCSAQSLFSDNNVAYIASRRFDTEIQCMGSNGNIAIIDVPTIGASTGITSVGDRLYVREVGTIGTVYQSSTVSASNDSYQITEGVFLIIPASGVLSNDSGGLLIVDQVNGSADVGLNIVLDINLIIIISTDGSLLINATQVTNVAEGESQVVTFSYRASDGIENNMAEVSITIQGINHAPLAQDDLFNSLEDEILNANVMDDNGLDIDDDPDQNQNIFIESPNAITLTGIGGDIVVNSNGSFSYTPPIDTNGTAMFDYTLSDGSLTSQGTAVIDITGVNDRPSFNSGSNQFSLSSTTGVQTIPMWATSISAGPDDESLQTLTFSVNTTADPNSIVSAISISAAGTLEYTLTANQGLAQFNVFLLDNGGMDNGGLNSSIPHELIISKQDGVNLVTLITDNRYTVEDTEQLTYEIIISNEGPLNAINANVNNSYSPELINVSWTCIAEAGSSCSASGNNNITDTIDLTAGSYVTYVLTATVDGTEGTIENTVDAQPAVISDELVPENNSATEYTIIGELLFKDGFE